MRLYMTHIQKHRPTRLHTSILGISNYHGNRLYLTVLPCSIISSMVLRSPVCPLSLA